MSKNYGEIILNFDENCIFTGSRILADTDREQAKFERMLEGIAKLLKKEAGE